MSVQGGEVRRALIALLLGAALGAIVGLLARRSPGDAETAPEEPGWVDRSET